MTSLSAVIPNSSAPSAVATSAPDVVVRRGIEAVVSDSCSYTWQNGYHSEVMHFAFMVASCSATPSAFQRFSVAPAAKQVSPLSQRELSPEAPI